MIRYLTHSEIDIEKWDRCIEQSVNGSIFASSWYLDVVHPGWEALVENDYEKVMPLTCGQKWGIHYLFQPPFTQQLGIFSTTPLTPDTTTEFLQYIPRKYQFIEINLNTLNQVDYRRSEFTPWVNYQLDLIRPYDQLKEGYSENLRRNLKKASRAGITLFEYVRPSELITLFRQNKGRQLKHLTGKHYDLLQKLMQIMLSRKLAIVLGVYDRTNSLCAGAFFVQSHQRVIFYFSATDQVARETGAMPFLIDHFIQQFSQSNLILDFEGSNNPDLARFYEGFGAMRTVYPHYTVNNLAFPLKTAVHLVKRFRAWFYEKLRND